MGRLQPQGEVVIKLSAATSTNGNRVDQLLVKEGDRVKAGQAMAILDSRDRLQAALEESERQVASARAKLAQTMAGAKSGEIAAQVRRQTIVNTDPSTNIDARIVEVHVTLDRASSQKAAKSTNLQVRVAIEK